jgi:predicted RND superfamily exporter protein
MAVAASATVITLGASIVAGIAMSLVTQIIVILSCILPVANMVHITVSWQEASARLGGARRRWAGLITLKHMIAPTTAASLATVFGFMALCVSHLVVLRDFAKLMSLAIVIGWIVGLAAVRLMSAVLPIQPVRPTTRLGPLERVLGAFAGIAGRHGWAVAVVCAVVVVVGAGGAARLRYESDFLQNFRRDSEVRRSYATIDRELAPVGSVEVVVRRRDGGPMVTVDAVVRARRLTDAVVERFAPVRKAMSLADLLTAGGQPMPESELAISLRMTLAEALFGEGTMRNFLNEDRTAMRINLRAREGVQVAEKLTMAGRIGDLAAGTFGDQYEAEVTGLYPFYASVVAGLLRDQNVSFAVAVILILACMAVFFRSLAVGVIAIVPNLVPIGLTMGLMGWRGIAVNMATATILAVSTGIAVDDALHYTWRFRRERRRRAPLDAMLTAHITTGRACVFTGVVVVCGFWILCLSEFLPTAYFGGLVGITMVGTLVADLTLFPMLLLRVAGRGIGRQ